MKAIVIRHGEKEDEDSMACQEQDQEPRSSFPQVMPDDLLFYRETTEIGKGEVGVTRTQSLLRLRVGVVSEKQEWKNMNEGPG